MIKNVLHCLLLWCIKSRKAFRRAFLEGANIYSACTTVTGSNVLSHLAVDQAAASASAWRDSRKARISPCIFFKHVGTWLVVRNDLCKGNHSARCTYFSAYANRVKLQDESLPTVQVWYATLIPGASSACDRHGRSGVRRLIIDVRRSAQLH